MTVTSYETQLENVQAAIARIETGAQSYSIAGRSKQNADLEALYAREKWLRKMVDRATNGGIRLRGATPV